MLAATAFGVVAVGAGAGVLLYKWKNKDGDGEASRELDFSAIPAEKKVFGVALSEIKEEYKIDGVPKIIHDCFRIIKEKYGEIAFNPVFSIIVIGLMKTKNSERRGNF